MKLFRPLAIIIGHFVSYVFFRFVHEAKTCFANKFFHVFTDRLLFLRRQQCIAISGTDSDCSFSDHVFISSA